MNYTVEVNSQEELEALKTKCMKCKVILLDEWDKHPLDNPALFDRRKKDKFTNQLAEMMKTWSDEDIDKEFGYIVSDKLLASGTDVSKYITSGAVPDHSILYKVDETAVCIEDGIEEKSE